MASLGKRLRLAREKQGLALSELAERTCICSRYLVAMEEDRPEVLPGHFFYRNWLKQYAALLGLDAEAMVREADRLVAAEEPDPVPALVEARATVRSAKPRQWRSAAVVATLLGILAGGSVLYAVYDKRAPHHPRPVVEAAPPKVEISAPAPQPTRGLKLAATEPTWVSMSANGRTLFRGTLQADEIREFENLEQAKLTTGNAAGLAVEWNGKPLGPLGSRGQVRTVVFAPGYYEVLAPRL